jgi:hypothetical protein
MNALFFSATRAMSAATASLALALGEGGVMAATAAIASRLVIAMGGPSLPVNYFVPSYPHRALFRHAPLQLLKPAICFQ